MKKKDLKNVTPEELRKQIARGMVEMKSRKIKNTNMVKNLKKDLARLLTETHKVI